MGPDNPYYRFIEPCSLPFTEQLSLRGTGAVCNAGLLEVSGTNESRVKARVETGYMLQAASWEIRTLQARVAELEKQVTR